MKKYFNQTLEEDVNEKGALTRKLYRYISDAAKRVDEGTSKSKSISDLFAPSLEVNRQKLRENCEKLIFADPLLYGRKAQELLWRKGYYEAVATSKKFRETCKDQEQLVTSHIEAGIGHYHTLISKIQHEIGIEINFSLDYPQTEIISHKHHNNENVKEFVKTFVQNCLIYLGDLSRYKADYGEPWAFSMAYRSYMQAASIDENCGMPYNQLGTLHTGRNHHLDSASYYIGCLLCDSPFDGAQGNLLRIFDKNNKQLENIHMNPDIVHQQELVKMMICKFLSLVEHWFFEKPMPEFNEFCTSTLYDIKECLRLQPLLTKEEANSSEDYFKYLQQNESSPDYVTPNLMNRMVLTLLLLINKLQKENSDLLMSLKTFTLTILSQLLHKIHLDFITIGFDKDVVSKIIEEFKEKVRNQKNNNKTISKLENGHHEVAVSDNVEESLKETNNTDKTPAPNAEEPIITEVNIRDKIDKKYQPINGHLDIVQKSSKAKNKKASLLLKLRRRKRNSVSGCSDSSDDDSQVGSFHSDDESGDHSDQLTTDESDECEEDEDGDFYSTTSSENEGDNHNVTDEETKGKKKSEEEDSENQDNNGEKILSNGTNIKVDLSNTDHKQDQREVKENSMGIVKNDSEDTKITSTPFNNKLFRDLLENDNLLVSLHLILSWLFGEGDLIISCGTNGRAMFLALVNVLNTIHGQMFPKLSWNNYSLSNQFHPSLKSFHELFFSLKYNGFRKIPTAEDYEVKNLEICTKGLKYIDWERNKRSSLSKVEANTIRLMKIVDFGAFIVKLNVGIVFNKRLKLYLLKKMSSKKANFKKYGKSSRDIHNKSQRSLKGKNSDWDKISGKPNGGSLMKNLGRLWLSEQVRALESEVGSKKQPNLPAYVILDADALSQQTHLVKQLVASKKLIVLVPTIVLHTMDELKKDSGAARSAIRWLENQLSNGSRFIRTQRPNENTPLPHIKYPKKVHRHVQNFIQIIEFCHFFLSNDPGESSVCKTNMNGSGDSNHAFKVEAGKNGEIIKMTNQTSGNHLVILLTGSANLYTEQKDFSYKGVAHSAGVSMESIQDFCYKWRHYLGKGTKKR